MDKQKIRVLYVIGDLDSGGAEHHLVKITPILENRNIQPSFYTISHKGKLAGKLEDQGIKIYEPVMCRYIYLLPRLLRKIILFPASFMTLWVLVLYSRPDVVHFFLPQAYLLGGFCSLLTPGTKRIMSRRCLNVYQQNHPVMKCMELFLHKYMDMIFGNSKAVLSQLREEKVPESKLRLIYNGVELPPLHDNKKTSQFRKSLNIDDDDLVFIIVSNLIPYKGHADLLNAFELIKDKLGKKWKLLCVGRDDGIGQVLRRQAETLNLSDHVYWLGERDDVGLLLAASNIYISASHQEGFSNSIIEAMATGLPIIATNVGGNPEAVVHNLNGVIVEPEQPESMSREILLLSADESLRKQMGEQSRKRAEELFSMEGCINRYTDYYRELFDQKTV